MATLSATATLQYPLQLRPQQRPSSVHMGVISAKTVTVTLFAIARVQREPPHALSGVTMSPTTMVTLIANVPLHSAPPLLVSPVPTVVHQTRISGARHTAGVTHRLRPALPTLLLVILRATTPTTILADDIAIVQALLLHIVTTRVTMATTILGTTCAFALPLHDPPQQLFRQVINS